MSAMHGHGLVIGKFYPPHAGHRLLIETAASVCTRVTVVVMASSVESIGLEQRVAWMQEIFRAKRGILVTGVWDDVPVDYANPGIWDQHVALMRQALDEAGTGAVDAVFTSEPYGGELARRFGAKAVTLDQSRALVPVSATRVRADVPGTWTFLDAPVQASLALRVVVLGAESTGTTTLSRDIVAALSARPGADALTKWVPEYGREYSIRKYAQASALAQLEGRPAPEFGKLTWRSAEFMSIARAQRRMEEEHARAGGPVLVCDTDVLATGVWHERYLHRRHRAVEVLAAKRPGNLYLLTHHEGVPFEQDGIRDGESIREWMTDRFLERLQESGCRFVVLRGTREQRLQQGLAAVDALRQVSWKYAAPLG